MKYGIWKIHRAVTAAQIEAIPGCTPLLSAILQQRGLAEEPARSEFLYGGVELLHDPFLLDDMDKAVARMRLAAERKEKIGVYGDYDVDGITSSCMVADWLGSNGFDCTVYIPDRVSEGYGLNRDAIARLHSRGVRLIITVDCGVTAVEEAAYARSLGMDLIITDHHECAAGALPEAAAVIDPKRPDSRYPNRDLAGVGVAFKLLSALEGEPEPILLRWSDLIALGTVADVMPLTGENRMLVSTGMCKLRFDPLPGLAALIAQAGAAGRRVNSAIFGYTLAPRLNAAGRLCRTDLAVELLLTEDGDRADELAQELCELNRSRQQMEQTIWTQSHALLAEDGVPDGPIVLAGEQWHQGVIGIAASRLAEDYLRPAIMITFDGGEIGKGSCRSFGGFNLYEALAACSEYLVNFGGHALAAGLNIRREQLEVFRRALTAYYNANKPVTDPALEIDLELRDPELLQLYCVESLELLEPYGNANLRPEMCVMDAYLESAHPIGNGNHLRLSIRKFGQSYACVFFGRTLESLSAREGDRVDVAFYPQVNEFRGRRNVQLLVTDLRRADPITLCRKLLRHERLEPEEARRVCPGRQELVRVWRLLESCGGIVEGRPEAVFHVLDIGGEAGCVCACLMIFQEAGLLQLSMEDGILSCRICPGAPRADLEKSEILKSLRRRAGGGNPGRRN